MKLAITMPPGDDHNQPSTAPLSHQIDEMGEPAHITCRTSTRMTRLLGVLAEHLPPDELIDRTLTVLAEVYAADVACLAEVHPAGLTITHTHTHGPASPTGIGIGIGVTMGPSAAEAWRTGRVVTADPLGAEDTPPGLTEMRPRTGAWLALPPGDRVRHELLMLFRRSDEPFSQAELTALAPTIGRLPAAVAARERARAMDRLARLGHQLGRHLNVNALLAEAVTLLAQLAGAEQAWIIRLVDGAAELWAHIGLAEAAVAGWPRPLADLPVWGRARSGEPYFGGVGADPDDSVLCVPLLREDVAVALLCAARPGGRAAGLPRSARSATAEVVAIFAEYLSVALANAELYRALAQNEATLRRRATHDPLTGLANRVLVGQRLDDALARTGASTVGLLFCDLDRFKEVNDRLGHEAGDELLQQVAHRLRGCVRQSDLLARFGGDEFVVVLDEVRELSEIADVGRRLLAALNEPFTLRGEQVTISVSIGGVRGARGRTTASAMLRRADGAMYAAKARGLGMLYIVEEAQP